MQSGCVRNQQTSPPDLTAPSTVGTYYYGACVEQVSGESNTGNNCSDAETVTVVESPDLVVKSTLQSTTLTRTPGRPSP